MTARIARFVTLLHLCVAGAAWAQSTAATDRSGPSLEDARRLTWRLETRSEGVDALRTLAASASEGFEARFELGRVLTWDVRTRSEGISILRKVRDSRPADLDVSETLAEVLSWDVQTRPEGIQMLQSIVERYPNRLTARLKLAEIWSWDAETRQQAKSMYESVLRDEPGSVQAAIGLARALAWTGRFADSREWYRFALSRDPSAEAARVGTAQIDTWIGRPRAALRTVADGVQTPDAYRVRAEAYDHIGRRAKALHEYEHVLSVEADDAPATAKTREIRQALRPWVEFGPELSTSSGNESTRMNTSLLPVRVSLHPTGGDAEVSFTIVNGAYRNGFGTSQDRLAGVRLEAPFGDRIRTSVAGAAHQYGGHPTIATGRAQLEMALTDAVDIRIGAAREALSTSRLAVAGQTVGGSVYGPALVTEAALGFAAREEHGFDVWAQGSGGQITGTNLATNHRNELFAGAGKSFRHEHVTVRPGYAVTWMAYSFGVRFPSADESARFDPTPVGGYFSPLRFLNQMGRLDSTASLGRSTVLVAGLGVGRQQIDEMYVHDFGHRVTSSEAYLGFTMRPNGRLVIGSQVNYQNVAAAYDRVVLRAQIAIGL